MMILEVLARFVVLAGAMALAAAVEPVVGAKMPMRAIIKTVTVEAEPLMTGGGAGGAGYGGGSRSPERTTLDLMDDGSVRWRRP